jgi:hypothetical protein
VRSDPGIHRGARPTAPARAWSVKGTCDVCEAKGSGTVYLLTCRVLGPAVLVFRGDRTKAELLVHRHAWLEQANQCGRVAPHPVLAVSGRAWLNHSSTTPSNAAAMQLSPGTRHYRSDLARHGILSVRQVAAAISQTAP